MASAMTNTTNSATQQKDLSTSTDQCSTARKRNAFSELMSPNPKIQKPSDSVPDITTVPHHAHPSHFSKALIPYIQHPENYPSEVVTFNDHIVLLKDRFPKSIVHLLLLARDPKYHNMKPTEAFSKQHDADGSFLALMKDEADKARRLAASELRRLISKYSSRHSAREKWLEDESGTGHREDEQEPVGREYADDIRVGVHAQPSMASLHIHIISRDMASEKLKHKKHYNSFNTLFFVELQEFPLLDGDARLDGEFTEKLLRRDLQCWRCGRDFKNQFVKLREHLKEEVERWKQD